MKQCLRCGTEFEGESSFCPECTAVVQPANENRTEILYTQPNTQQVPPPPSYQQAPTQQNYQQVPPQQDYQQVPPQQPPYQQAPPYQPQGAYPPPYPPPYPPQMEVDAPNTGFAVLCFFFPMVGLILWLVWKDKTPLKAKSCGKGALIGVIVNTVISILFVIFYVFVIVAATSTSMSSGIYY